MENSGEIHEIPAKKARKAYTRKLPSEIPAPIPVTQAPNPHISAMEAEILGLVGARSQAATQISLANRQLQQAQNNLRNAQEEFQRFEAEVQYRMQIVAQMRGGTPHPLAPAIPPYPPPQPGIGYAGPPIMSPPYAPAQPYPPYPPAFDPRMVPATGVGSAPAPNRGLYPDLVGGPDGELTSSAEQMREDPQVRDAFRQRGY